MKQKLDYNKQWKDYFELAKKLATDYRDQLITELISNGAGYTKRHGI